MYMINSHSDSPYNYFESECCDDQTWDFHNQQALSPLIHAFHPVPELPQKQLHWFAHSSAHSKYAGWTNNTYDDAAAVSADAVVAAAVSADADADTDAAAAAEDHRPTHYRKLDFDAIGVSYLHPWT